MSALATDARANFTVFHTFPHKNLPINMALHQSLHLWYTPDLSLWNTATRDDKKHGLGSPVLSRRRKRTVPRVVDRESGFILKKTMNEKDFVPSLHRISKLLDGAIQIASRQRAQEMGARAIAVTDTQYVWGNILVHSERSGIKPIVGKPGATL